MVSSLGLRCKAKLHLFLNFFPLKRYSSLLHEVSCGDHATIDQFVNEDELALMRLPISMHDKEGFYLITHQTFQSLDNIIALICASIIHKLAGALSSNPFFNKKSVHII